MKNEAVSFLADEKRGPAVIFTAGPRLLTQVSAPFRQKTEELSTDISP